MHVAIYCNYIQSVYIMIFYSDSYTACLQKQVNLALCMKG